MNDALDKMVAAYAMATFVTRNIDYLSISVFFYMIYLDRNKKHLLFQRFVILFIFFFSGKESIWQFFLFFSFLLHSETLY